jgi:hypothetical protein
LTTLSRLSETRAKNNKQTLLTYLIQTCVREGNLHLVDFAQDIPSLSYAVRISMSAVNDELTTIETGLLKLEQQLLKTDNDVLFVDRFKTFVNVAKVELRLEREEYNATRIA